MTFTAYIQRQKSLIRSRREGAENARDNVIEEWDTEKLIGDLTSLKGLNTAERQRYSKLF